MRNRLVFGAAFSVIATLSACSSNRSDAELTGAQRAATSASVPLAEALAAAQAHVPGGVPIAWELETENARSHYSIEMIADRGHMVEVEVDAATAAIIEEEHETISDRYQQHTERLLSAAPSVPVTFSDARDRVASARPGMPVIGGELDLDGDALMYEFVLVNHGKAMEVEFNPLTGAIKDDSSHDDDDDEDDEENDDRDDDDA